MSKYAGTQAEKKLQAAVDGENYEWTDMYECRKRGGRYPASWTASRGLGGPARIALPVKSAYSLQSAVAGAADSSRSHRQLFLGLL